MCEDAGEASEVHFAMLVVEWDDDASDREDQDAGDKSKLEESSTVPHAKLVGVADGHISGSVELTNVRPFVGMLDLTLPSAFQAVNLPGRCCMVHRVTRQMCNNRWQGVSQIMMSPAL